MAFEALLVLGIAWLCALVGGVVVVLVRSGSPLTRLLAVDTLTLLAIAVLALAAGTTGRAALLDAALLLAGLSFAVTLAGARYLAGDRGRT